MDIEKTRIGTRIKFPFVPVKGALAHRLPTTSGGDGRYVGCTSGWALNVLGVSTELLSQHKNADDALKAAKPYAAVPNGLFNGVARLHDKERMMEAIKALKAEVATNSSFLTSTFGYSKVAVLNTAIAGILADYAKKDAPKAPVAPKASVYRR